MVLAISAFAQIDTHVVDSLQEAFLVQEGREKVKTMMELTWEFYDISFDDCIDWGEKAIQEANALGYGDLEAKANYVLGIQYAHHADLDLAKEYLNASYRQNEMLADTANMFEALWSIATYELLLGSIDSAALSYEKALHFAEMLNDSLSMAYVINNIATIHYHKNEFQAALDAFYKAKRISADVGMASLAMQAQSNIATICLESGKPHEAKEAFVSLLAWFEANEDYYMLQTICMNLGSLYANDFIDYDSAMYYYGKSMYYADCQVDKKIDQNRMRVLKSEALSEMADIQYQRGAFDAAMKGYSEALALAENESYLSGQMAACVGLGTVYSRLGQPAKSLQYLNRYFELESKTGITKKHAVARVSLILDYARLGRYDALESELGDIDEERAALVRENADLYDRNNELEAAVADLLAREEKQDTLLDSLQSKLQQYRLAFYGTIAIFLALCLGWLIGKWVKHYFGHKGESSE